MQIELVGQWSLPKALIGRAWRRARRTAAAGVKPRPLCRGERSLRAGTFIILLNKLKVTLYSERTKYVYIWIRLPSNETYDDTIDKLQLSSSSSSSSFLRATAYMLSAHMLSQFRPSVRLSVCPSVCHTGGSVKNG